LSTKKQEKSPEEKILEGVTEKGMRLEIQVTKILSENHFSVFNQVPYYDPIKKKIRTIDIKTSISKINYEKAEFKVEKILTLYIECKKNKQAKLIFFLKSDLLGKIEVFSRLFQKGVLSQLDRRYFYEGNAIGIIHQVVFGGDFFYGAQMQVLKSIEYLVGQIDNKIELVIPVIVFEGDMYELYLEKDEYKIRPIHFVQFLSSGIPEDNTSVFIDVVDIKVFQTYLELVKKRYDLFPKYLAPMKL